MEPRSIPLLPEQIQPEQIWELIVEHNKQTKDMKTINMEVPRQNNKNQNPVTKTTRNTTTRNK